MNATAATAAAVAIVAWASAPIHAATKEIIVVVDNMGNATFDPDPKVTVSKKAKDQVLFTFTTAYTQDRDVYVCARREGNKKKVPWKDCTPTTNPPGVLDKQFTLKTGTSVATQCKIKYPLFIFSKEKVKYCLFVTDGPAGSPLACPPPGNDCPKSFLVSELALEVEP